MGIKEWILDDFLKVKERGIAFVIAEIILIALLGWGLMMAQENAMNVAKCNDYIHKELCEKCPCLARDKITCAYQGYPVSDNYTPNISYPYY